MSDDEKTTSTTDTKADRTPEEIAASVAKLEAEAAKIRAETRKANAEAEVQEYEASAASIAHAMVVEKRDEELASDKYLHIYRFSGQVDSSSAKTCSQQLLRWSRLSPGCDMEVVFFSPGGSVIDGMMLYDTIIGLREAGHNITTTAMGYAASMGGILLQAGTTRRMGKEAYILIHEIAFGAIGKIGEVEDEVLFAKKITKRILNILAERSHMSAATIDKRWKRKDWWLDSDEALKHGFVDVVI